MRRRRRPVGSGLAAFSAPRRAAARQAAWFSDTSVAIRRARQARRYRPFLRLRGRRHVRPPRFSVPHFPLIHAFPSFRLAAALFWSPRSRPSPPPRNPTVSRRSARVVLDAVVVTDSLDQAREDIVPSLGATSYQVDAAQIERPVASRSQRRLRSDPPPHSLDGRGLLRPGPSARRTRQSPIPGQRRPPARRHRRLQPGAGHPPSSRRSSQS